MTQTKASTIGKALFSLPSGIDIYDALMATIDPELISVNLSTLQEKYKNESERDRGVRLKRYQAAYAAYDKAYAIWIGTLEQRVDSYRRDVLRLAEEKDRAGETHAMEALDAALAA